MKNILIGADLTTNSENAFDRAVQLAALSGARLHVLHVDRRLQVPGAEAESSAHRAALEDRLRESVESRARSGVLDYDIHLEVSGRTYDLINQLARKTAADLVVIGRSKRLVEVPGAVLLTTGQVVAGSGCPVLVVTRPVSGHYKRIALQMKMSRATERNVLSAVCGLGPDVQLTVFQRALDNTAIEGLLGRMQRTMRKRRQRQFTARAASQLRRHGIADDRLSISETDGEPFERLNSVLRAEQFDVVVLTAMHRNLNLPMRRERLISALQAASCDTLIFAA